MDDSVSVDVINKFDSLGVLDLEEKISKKLINLNEKLRVGELIATTF